MGVGCGCFGELEEPVIVAAMVVVFVAELIKVFDRGSGDGGSC